MAALRARRIGFVVAVVVLVLSGAAVAGRHYLRSGDGSPPNPPAPNQPVEPTVAEAPPSGPAAAPPTTPLAQLTVPIVYLEPVDPVAPTKDGRVHAILLRELVRQAFLMAARDGLGLATRDALVGESPPDDLPADNRLALDTWLMFGKPSSAHIGRGPVGTRQYVWSEQGLPEPKLDGTDVLTMTTAAEQLSRENFANALRRIGFTGSPNRSGAAAVPADVETALADPCFVTQFTAVRTLHARIRTEGESPALIGALVRGYANLGVLTEKHWGSAHKVFRARSLLYAQRLVVADPKSPWGLWHRAYAAGLAGAHTTALADLATAGPMAAPAGGPPAWVGLVDALCRFDTVRLGQPPADARSAPWAAVFRYLTAENPDSVQLAMVTGRAALTAAPDCDRARDGLAEIGGTPHRHKATADSVSAFAPMLARRLSAAPGLPTGVADLVKPGGTESAALAALVAAGKPVDAGELTWAVPARLAADAHFAQAVTRLEFLKDVANQPTVAELKTIRPLIAGHPLAAYPEIYGMDRKKDRERIAQTLTGFQYRDLSPRHLPLYHALARLGDDQRKWARDMITMTADLTYGDCAALTMLPRQLDNLMGPAESVARASNFAPSARADYIDQRWDATAALAVGWEQESQNPIVLTALGRRYTRDRQWPAAERCLRKAVDNTADAAAYEALANLYLAQGKPAEWESTLETLFKRPDVDPFMAILGMSVGRRFLTLGQPAKALPYAEAAAEAGAERGPELAIECAERLGDWAKAEGWAKRTSEQHAERVILWYLWCHRTGRGDLDGATALLDKWQNRPEAEPEELDYFFAAARHLLGDQPGSGAQLLESAAKIANNERVRLMAGIMYDAAGRTEDRDRTLAALPKNTPMARLAALFKEAWYVPDLMGRLDNAAAERIMSTMPADRIAVPLYAIGRFHLNRGDVAKARSYLEQVSQIREEMYPAALAAHDLRALDKKEASKGKDAK
jgi:uncharacterized protein HemY